MQLYSNDFGPDEKIGCISLSCADVRKRPNDPVSWHLASLLNKHQPEERDPKWFPLAGRHRKRVCGQVRLTIDFTPVTSQSDSLVVTDCYFSSLKDNQVTLYQDAETPRDPLFDKITHADGSSYQPTNCFKDIYQAIRDAKRIIYITGWSVWTETVLVRDDDEDQVTLGDLLKQKVST